MLFITKQLATEVLIVPGLRRNFDHSALARRPVDERSMSVVVVDGATSG
jgi:hypothetical protein